MEEVSVKIQSSFLSKVMKVLPSLSAGKWNLNVEAVGGGVQDGNVKSDKGYLLDDVEDLNLKMNSKPVETLFLKGYIGTTYQNGNWKSNYGSTFDGAAMNWNTEGNPRLYIQNLPFLRTTFALKNTDSQNQAVKKAMNGITASQVELQVEKVHGNDKYTFVPYGAYLNDYYQVDSGDGAVTGQTSQQDQYYFYFRKDMKNVLKAWNSIENTSSVLDRTEESYQAYCKSNREIPDIPGMDALQKKVDKAIAENRWKGIQDVDEITAWIRSYLSENYQYEKSPKTAPNGEDELEYFLFTSKKGNSVQFASAAVILYRMFGIPARYVVGYELPAALFTAQPDGTYTAVAQGNQSQAWAEVYEDGIGWTPKELTPGVIGTYEEAGPGAELIEPDTRKSDHTDTKKNPDTEQNRNAGSSRTARILNLTIGQIVWFLLGCVIVVALICAAVFGTRSVCNTFGYSPTHKRDRLHRLLGVFRALFKRMKHLGLADDIDSQDEAFIEFGEKIFAKRIPDACDQWKPLMHDLYASCYGDRIVTEKDIRAMRRFLLAAYGVLPKSKKSYK